MPKWKPMPVAMTIAGSDSGGGAGIQADLKTFASLGVHGTCVVTAVTAQNPCEILGVQPCAPKIVRNQIEAVYAQFSPKAIKIGMLFSRPIIHSIAQFFKHQSHPPLIVDPVIAATSGARLLKPSAVQALCQELLPLAGLVTPNLAEAEILTGRSVKSISDIRSAARAIHQAYGCAVLVKGGHLTRLNEAVDIYYDGPNELLLTAPRIKRVSPHGTGCTVSAAIAAYLALGSDLSKAVQSAKDYISSAIRLSRKVNGHFVLNNPPS